MRRHALRFMAALFAVLALGSTLRTPAAAQEGGDPLQVVATFSILGDLVQNVGGDRIELTTIIQAGADAHTFEPTPRDAEALAEADLIFEHGLDFEPWLDDLDEASGGDASRVVVSEGITPREAEAHEGEHEDEEGDEHGEFDPHTWHDVANAMLMVQAIRDALVAADPADAATYQANADAYLQRLQALDDFVVAEVAKLPEERRKLVTSHDTFGYFAARYGFEIVGTAFGSITTEGADPSAEEIDALVEQIEAAGVPAIFAENVSNPALMESVAAEADVVLGPTLYTDALGEPDSDGATYEAMITYNVTTIVTALGQ
jgi:zinc/manganese transport system substrate-binding protein